MADLRLIVGLGNPGREYASTRHNAGERWLRCFSERFDIALGAESRFLGECGRAELFGQEVRVLFPTTFMNASGQAIGATARFFKIAPSEILIVYDDVAFPLGVSKIRLGGGHNGHNGIKSAIGAFAGTSDFARLRIGVGHPGDPDRMTPFLTRVRMSADDLDKERASAWLDDEVVEFALSGHWQKAMTRFHAPEEGQVDA
mgnify:FL=1